MKFISRDEDLALVGGTIYASPTEEPVRDGAILIHDTRITAVGTRALVQIPESAQRLDCSGLTITAGFWNSHVHFTERKWMNAGSIPATELRRQLQDMITRYGFTNVFDLSSRWEDTRQIRDRIESGEVFGPGIRSTGEALLPPNALPSETVVNMMGWANIPVPEVADAEQAAAASKQLLERGVDGIKVFASGQRGAQLAPSAIRAAVIEAHRLGKPVFVHPNNSADVLAAVRGGVDIVAYTTPHSGEWDETILDVMKERQVALIPTLWIWKYYARHDRLSTQQEIAKTAVSQLRAWVETGGTVLFGTDLGAVDPDPSEEYALMTEAGMTFRQILAALTSAPAERFGEAKQLGRIASGFQADLAVLRQDPSIDICALTAVQYTLRAGKIIYRSGE